jgi:hypothetical protein
MAAEVDYDWKLRLRLAENGIYKASELRPLLAERGVRLSEQPNLAADHRKTRAPEPSCLGDPL